MKPLAEMLPTVVQQAEALQTLATGKVTYLEPETFTCAGCQDMGFVRYNLPVGHPDFGKMFPCPDCGKGTDLQTRRWRNQLKTAALPELYQDMTFATWEQLPDELQAGKRLAYVCARLFAEAPDYSVNLARGYDLCNKRLGYDLWRKSLIFQGPMGTGKTGLAAAIINALLAQQKPALYIRTQDFLESVKARFKIEEPPSADEIIATVKTAPVLVLDEFNVTVTGEWRQETMEQVIRYRHGRNLPTIITCNATKDELTSQWGARTMHVLFSMAHWLPMGGAVIRDLRGAEGRPF